MGFQKSVGLQPVLSAITNAGNGVYTATYSGLVAGSAQTLGIIADGSALGPSTSITVVAGSVDAANSSLNIAAASITSGSNTTVTATLRDANNNPINASSVVTFSKTIFS